MFPIIDLFFLVTNTRFEYIFEKIPPKFEAIEGIEKQDRDVKIRATLEKFVKIGNFIDGSIVSPGISRVNH